MKQQRGALPTATTALTPNDFVLEVADVIVVPATASGTRNVTEGCTGPTDGCSQCQC